MTIAHRLLARRALLPLVAALALAGCATALPPIDAPVPPVARFKEADARWTVAPPAAAAPRGAWWTVFGDAELDGLVERADREHPGIQAAAARLAQARALLRSAQAERRPQLGAGVGAARQTQAGAGPAAASLLSAGVDLSYEVDLVGRLQRGVDAATLDAQSREALLQSTRLLVQAHAAQTYLALRTLDDERALVRDTVAAYRDTLRLTERRFQAGDVAELDLARVQAEVAATEAEALALDRERAALEHALAALVGAPASDFALAPRAVAPTLPAIPPGIPATVLARRPDVAAAQAAMLAAQARVGVAQTAWFPRLALTAAGGVASPELGDLFQWSARNWGLGALLSLPLFDGGRRDAALAGARAELDAAAAAHREQVLAAFQDVEDQLSALRLLAEQADAQAQAVAAAGRATLLSDTRYRNGYVSQLELLDARRSELRNRRAALQVRAAQQQATVALVRALGGGWDAAPAAPAVGTADAPATALAAR